MPITRSQFRESVAIRNEIVAETVKLGTYDSDLKVVDVRGIEAPKGATDSAVVFTYEYKVTYNLVEPKNQTLGKIAIKGEIIYVDAVKAVAEMVSGWKKDKKVKPDMLQEILNYALRDAQIEALEQSKKVGLPMPVPLPTIRSKDGKSSAA